MKPFTLPPDQLLVLLRPDATFDQRKVAAVAFARECWEKGWDACDEEYKALLKSQGLAVELPATAGVLS
jgi:hypothetical protein